jgi:hypothetical protein
LLVTTAFRPKLASALALLGALATRPELATPKFIRLGGTLGALLETTTFRPLSRTRPSLIASRLVATG